MPPLSLPHIHILVILVLGQLARSDSYYPSERSFDYATQSLITPPLVGPPGALDSICKVNLVARCPGLECFNYVAATCFGSTCGDYLNLEAFNRTANTKDWAKCICLKYAGKESVYTGGGQLGPPNATERQWITSNVCTGLAYTPWDWTVQPLNPSTRKCPSASRVLTTFAIVNVAVGCLGLIFGHRKIVNRASFGLLGKPDSKAWRFTWIITVASQFGANYLIAMLIKMTPGYGQSFTAIQLTLLLFARPRIGCFIALAAAYWDRYGDGVYASFALSHLIAEIILQILAAPSVGYAAGLAATRGILIQGRLHNQYAKLMYGGTFFWLCSSFVFFVGTLWVFRRRLFFLFSRNLYAKKEQNSVSCTAFLGGGFIFLTQYIALWLFWGGFIGLAGETYCPPNLAQQGLIWTGFSLFGAMVGGGA
ncbi:hypothetical protein BCR34DRAFT_250074 [Clohesyomyces aquaticus]|uniref:Uncharacterized protein n=1 Tax=Clohesyomyces aquaticus TaxID=1231657 RepID=A0A1Y1ZV93_9PLEO|nr:hypothetical protein BCR34DRAFT_250074 [Clohesyomyces aquaticus]